MPIPTTVFLNWSVAEVAMPLVVLNKLNPETKVRTMPIGRFAPSTMPADEFTINAKKWLMSGAKPASDLYSLSNQMVSPAGHLLSVTLGEVNENTSLLKGRTAAHYSFNRELPPRTIRVP